MSSQSTTHQPVERTGLSVGENASRACWLREPDANDVNDIVNWLAEPDINQWFDFGEGRQTLSVLAMRLMMQSARHRLRVFGLAGHNVGSGLLAVSDLSHAFGNGSFWVLRDARRPACQDMTLLASRQILQDAFDADRLHCVTAWAVDCNVRSRRLLERIGFRTIGLQRNCHVIHGSRCGRVLYDLLPENLADAPDLQARDS